MRLAIVGAGKIAREHAKAFLDIENTELLGVTSRSKKPLEAFATDFKVTNKCDNIGQLYRTTQAELVIITVNVDQISNVLLECALYPWTILVEKPLGINLTESNYLDKVLGDAANRIYVALNRRHYSTFQELDRIINLNSGQRMIRVTDQEDQFAARSAGFDTQIIEHWMFANSIHLIDILRQFGRGKVINIEQSSKWKSMTIMKHSVHVTFDSGDLGIYECQWNEVGPWSVSITKENSTWLMKPLEKLTEISETGESIDITPKSDWDTKFKPGFRLQAEMMIAKIKGQESKIVSFKDALSTMQLVHEMYES
jgi:predicted dehydrogenase